MTGTEATGEQMFKPVERPLDGIRVIDLAEGKAEMCGRVLADLGAEVLRVEPPHGAATRLREPMVEGVSLYFATHNANKLGITLDLTTDAGRGELLDLANSADILIETERPGALDSLGVGVDALRARNPALVVVSITDFGQIGPRRDWVASDAVHIALGGELSKSGIAGREPMLPPGELAYECAALQAAFAGLLAYANRMDSGNGDHVDCSVNEITTQIIDPGLGIGGSALNGVTHKDLGRGRPAEVLYPIFRCVDGLVRLSILSPRQWRKLFSWIGEPEEFADAKYEEIAVRREAHAALHAPIAAAFENRTTDELMAEGLALGVPIEVVRSPRDVLNSPHFLARRSIIDAEVAPGVFGRLPDGYLEIDGVRAGFRHRAPEVGEHNGQLLTRGRNPGGTSPNPPSKQRPLRNLRILDLGIIVAGAETSRLLADQGAEVIKIENSSFLDGARPIWPTLMTESFAAGNRNKLSMGINLRDPLGLQIFKDLVAKSDVVLSNFKPGTMDSLGLGHEVLREINPAVIVVESSALGATGPWSKRMGYGPLVRASVGLTSLWRDPTVEDGFCDGLTTYPDHAAGRVGALGVLAALIQRRRTGQGSAVSVAQAETVLAQFSTEFLRESLAPGTMEALGNRGEWNAPHGVYACAGDDEWCVIEVEHDGQWGAICTVIQRSDLATDPRLATAAGRLEHRHLIDGAISDWTATVSPQIATERLQAAGVPAGFLQRIPDFFEDPQMAARRSLRTMSQTHLAESLTVENGPAIFGAVVEPELGPAPLLGEHTRRLASTLLGMSDSTIQDLIDGGVLQEAVAAGASPSVPVVESGTGRVTP